MCGNVAAFPIQLEQGRFSLRTLCLHHRSRLSVVSSNLRSDKKGCIRGHLGEQLKNAGELLELVRSLIEDCLFPLFGNKLLEMSYDLFPACHHRFNFGVG